VKAVNILAAENREGMIDLARAVGSTETAMFIYDPDPGESSSPYHYEYVEEWLPSSTARLSCARLRASRR
jgi:hypothetical protein